MNYSKIRKTDIADGEGVRVSLFVSGCRHRCPNCFNPETWRFDYGTAFNAAAEAEIDEALSKSYINGLTVLGGEPFEPENQRALLPFLQRVRTKFPEKSIWCYSGSTLEEILHPGSAYHCEATEALLALIDVLVDGPFIEAQKDISLKFRGSSNQRLIDMKKTAECGKITRWGEGG